MCQFVRVLSVLIGVVMVHSWQLSSRLKMAKASISSSLQMSNSRSFPEKSTELDSNAKYWPTFQASTRNATATASINVAAFTDRFVEESSTAWKSLSENAKKSPIGKRAALLSYAEIVVLLFVVLGQFPIQLFPIFGWGVKTVAGSYRTISLFKNPYLLTWVRTVVT